MSPRAALILALTGLAVMAAFVYRNAQKSEPATKASATIVTAPPERGDVGGSDRVPAVAAAPTPTAAPRARFVELGSDSCRSCKAMIPVLDELRRAHPDTLEVVFIDVWKHPEAAEPYKISIIPSQVLFAPDGREIFRHQGFISADALRTRFRELGHPVDGPPPPRDPRTEG